MFTRGASRFTRKRGTVFFINRAEVARTYGLGLLPSVVASFGAIPDFGENLIGDVRRLRNV